MQSTEEQTPAVVMATEVADDLDNSLSPMDGLIAVAQVCHELGKQHLRRCKSRFTWPRRNAIQLFRARIEWCGLGVDYVERNGRLHVIAVWSDSDYRRRRREDCILSHPEYPEELIREVNADTEPAVD